MDLGKLLKIRILVRWNIIINFLWLRMAKMEIEFNETGKRDWPAITIFYSFIYLFTYLFFFSFLQVNDGLLY